MGVFVFSAASAYHSYFTINSIARSNSTRFVSFLIKQQAPEEVKLVWLLLLYISMILAWSYTTTLRSTVLLYAIFVAVTVFALRDTRRHWNDHPRPLHLVAHAVIFYMFTLISSTYVVLFIRWRKSDMSFWEFHYTGCAHVCSWSANQTPILETHQLCVLAHCPLLRR